MIYMLKGKILIVIRECNLNNQLRTKIILNIYIYYLTYIVVQNQNLILILIVDKNKNYSSIKFWSFSLPCFNKFRTMFYNLKSIKILPLEIETLLTARGLAYWIMDDGYKSANGFYICTESFSLSEKWKVKKNIKKEI